MNKKEIVTQPLTQDVEVLGVNEAHRATINEYYCNGFNKRKAVHSINPELSVNSANVTGSYIFNHPDNESYIRQKQHELRELTDIQNEHILRELINWAYSDATQFICLTKEEVKELPSDIKRSIQSIKIKTRTYYDKQIKEEVTEETLEIKMVDKTKAVEMINKHIGFYSEDNKQRGSNVNILQILKESSPDTLNTLLETINSNTKDDE